MRVLFDTNVILDVLLDRKPFSESASLLLSQVESSEIVGIICATTITTIYYLIRKSLNKKDAEECMDILLSLFEIAPVNRAVIETARKYDFSDFEDAVIYAAAIHSGAECIVTRNLKDFKSSKLPVFSPEELLAIIATKGNP